MLIPFLKAKARATFSNSQDPMAGVKNVLNFLDESGLYPEFHAISAGVNEAECVIDGKKYLMFCSNNYLSLSEHPDVKQAAKDAIDKYGVGPGGSRVISGNVDIIEELEAAIADLVGTEDCLTFPTGYMANIAVFQALMDPLFHDMPAKSADSVIFSDEYNHGSIVDGCRLSKAKKVIFKHDDLDDLRKKLKENDLPNKLIVTEGVFSLDGEIINIPNYISLAKEYGALLMIDDAHGIGVIGPKGGGTASHYGCTGGVDITMGCMDKAFGGTGGFLCGSSNLIKYLRVASRSSILSSAIPVGMAGAMLKSIRLIKLFDSKRDEIIGKAVYVSTKLKEIGFRVIERDPIPVVSLFVGKETQGITFSNLLWEKGIFSPIIRWPAVPEGESRFRILMMDSHKPEHLDRFISACEFAGKTLKLI